jgi:hypothetical protein
VESINLKQRVELFWKKFYLIQRISYFITLFPLLWFFAGFFDITRGMIFYILMDLASLDIYFTNKLIIITGNPSNELNPIPKLLMKIFKKYWIYPMFIFMYGAFYLVSFVILLSLADYFFFIGFYAMVVNMNFIQYTKLRLLKKYNIKAEFMEVKENR